NESRLMGLASIDDDLRKNVNEMKERNFEIRVDKERIKNLLDSLEFNSADILKMFRQELSDINVITQNVRVRIEELNRRLEGKVGEALRIMDGLQNNSSFIGESTWLFNWNKYTE